MSDGGLAGPHKRRGARENFSLSPLDGPGSPMMGTDVVIGDVQHSSVVHHQLQHGSCCSRSLETCWCAVAEQSSGSVLLCSAASGEPRPRNRI